MAYDIPPDGTVEIIKQIVPSTEQTYYVPRVVWNRTWHWVYRKESGYALTRHPNYDHYFFSVSEAEAEVTSLYKSAVRAQRIKAENEKRLVVKRSYVEIS